MREHAENSASICTRQLEGGSTEEAVVSLLNHFQPEYWSDEEDLSNDGEEQHGPNQAVPVDPQNEPLPDEVSDNQESSEDHADASGHDREADEDEDMKEDEENEEEQKEQVS